MSHKGVKNVSASVRQRLLDLSRQTGTNYQRLLIRYAIERLLYRLSISQYADQFILKGAMLFTIWSETPFRGTKDLDMLKVGDNHPDSIRSIITSVIMRPVEDDGLIFDALSVQVDEIRKIDVYNGYRILMKGYLEKAEIPLQIDLGFGDAITPEPKKIVFPGLLDFPSAELRAYPPQTVVAEKLHAIVHLGMTNSRMKDYYDLSFILNQFDFEPAELAEAIAATFRRRKTDIPLKVPLGLSNEFAQDPEKQKQWHYYLKRQQLNLSEDFPNVVLQLENRLVPALKAAESIYTEG